MEGPRTLRFVLARARTLIWAESSWIGNEYGADRGGEWRPVGSRDAVRFSLTGALMRAGAPKQVLDEARELFEKLSPALSEKLRRQALSHRESMALLDAALARLASGDDIEAAPASHHETDDRSAGAE